MDWNTFISDQPERIVKVIESGPFPLSEYDLDKLPWRDKERGLMRYKGGDGNTKMKTGMAGIVYYDPAFASPEYQVDDIPSDVLERHSEEEVVAAFHKL